jgi:hypothetical protein
LGKHARQAQRFSTRRAAPAPASLAAPEPSRGVPTWLGAGFVLFFLAAVVYGVLDVHYSTDAWIGLAAGRDILSQPSFPKADTWTYTFAGKTWVNQNWLSHAFFWWLYDRLGANAVAIGTWGLDALIFTLVLIATRLRCGAWRPALLGAGLVAVATRDWLSPRPATIQLLLLALVWLSLSALLSPGPRRRWWPIILLVPAFLVWPHAHGSFIFGYAALGGFLVSAVIPAVFRRPTAITLGQGILIAGIALVTAVLGVVLSPYGLENLTHPLVVAESGVFRQVNEWLPPYVSAEFPPVASFWALLGGAIGGVLLVLILRTGARGAPADADSKCPPVPRTGWQPILFDLGSVAIGLVMALSARRFIAICYVLATPAVVTWLARLGRALSGERRTRVSAALTALSWPAALLVAFLALIRVQNEMVTGFPTDRHFNLLQRITRADLSPLDAVEFFRRNALKPNLFTQWSLAGDLLFEAPGVRVFIDGRAQQLFSEQHVKNYQSMLAFTEAEQPGILKRLDDYGTDAVLTQGTATLKQLEATLDRNQAWFRALDTPRCLLFLRRGTAFTEDLARRERMGELWWPDTPETLLGRGRLLILSKAPDWRRAVDFWEAGVARRPELGLACYATITSVLVQQGHRDEAGAYLQQQCAKVTDAGTMLGERIRSRLLAEIERCEQLMARLPP